MSTTFNAWLETFLEEKNINQDQFLPYDVGGWHVEIEFEALIEQLKVCPASEQQAIKSKIVQIDFINGDVMHFFKFLGQRLAELKVQECGW